jgi:fumarate hydratase subunit alpha
MPGHGHHNVLRQAGSEIPALDVVEGTLVEATRVATREIPLRPNSVDPITGKNPGDNTGRYTPVIIWDAIDPKGDYLEVAVVPGAAAQSTWRCSL